MKKDNLFQEKLLISGTIFIISGIALLLLNTGRFTGKELIWPLFLVMPGLYFSYKAFFRNGTAVYVLLGMFLVLSGIFMLLSRTVLEIQHIRRLWPVFMLFTGLALIPFGFKKQKGQRIRVFVPAAAIILLSLFFLPFSLKLMTTRFITFALIW